MRIKVRKIGRGLHPSEVIVEVATVDGSEQLVVDKRSIRADSVAIGAPLRKDEGRQLVELPRETMSGLWRVWVRPETLSPDLKAKAA
jgi:hypothetical protein